MINQCRCFYLCHYTWAQTLGIRWTAEHASIVMNSVWALLQKPMWYGWNSCKLSICWNHSKLFWADCKNPCAFWYFYVGVQVSWVTSTSWTPRFERIKYDTPFQRHTITEQKPCNKFRRGRLPSFAPLCTWDSASAITCFESLIVAWMS